MIVKLINVMKIEYFQKNTLIFEQNDSDADKAYVILDGEVNIFQRQAADLFDRPVKMAKETFQTNFSQIQQQEEEWQNQSEQDDMQMTVNSSLQRYLNNTQNSENIQTQLENSCQKKIQNSTFYQENQDDFIQENEVKNEQSKKKSILTTTKFLMKSPDQAINKLQKGKFIQQFLMKNKGDKKKELQDNKIEQSEIDEYIQNNYGTKILSIGQIYVITKGQFMLQRKVEIKMNMQNRLQSSKWLNIQIVNLGKGEFFGEESIYKSNQKEKDEQQNENSRYKYTVQAISNDASVMFIERKALQRHLPEELSQYILKNYEQREIQRDKIYQNNYERINYSYQNNLQEEQNRNQVQNQNLLSVKGIKEKNFDQIQNLNQKLEKKKDDYNFDSKNKSQMLNLNGINIMQQFGNYYSSLVSKSILTSDLQNYSLIQQQNGKNNYSKLLENQGNLGNQKEKNNQMILSQQNLDFHQNIEQNFDQSKIQVFESEEQGNKNLEGSLNLMDSQFNSHQKSELNYNHKNEQKNIEKKQNLQIKENVMKAENLNKKYYKDFFEDKMNKYQEFVDQDKDYQNLTQFMKENLSYFQFENQKGSLDLEQSQNKTQNQNQNINININSQEQNSQNQNKSDQKQISGNSDKQIKENLKHISSLYYKMSGQKLDYNRYLEFQKQAIQNNIIQEHLQQQFFLQIQQQMYEQQQYRKQQQQEVFFESQGEKFLKKFQSLSPQKNINNKDIKSSYKEQKLDIIQGAYNKNLGKKENKDKKKIIYQKYLSRSPDFYQIQKNKQKEFEMSLNNGFQSIKEQNDSLEQDEQQDLQSKFQFQEEKKKGNNTNNFNKINMNNYNKNKNNQSNSQSVIQWNQKIFKQNQRNQNEKLKQKNFIRGVSEFNSNIFENLGEKILKEKKRRKSLIKDDFIFLTFIFGNQREKLLSFKFDQVIQEAFKKKQKKFGFEFQKFVEKVKKNQQIISNHVQNFNGFHNLKYRQRNGQIGNQSQIQTDVKKNKNTEQIRNNKRENKFQFQLKKQNENLQKIKNQSEEQKNRLLMKDCDKIGLGSLEKIQNFNIQFLQQQKEKTELIEKSMKINQIFQNQKQTCFFLPRLKVSGAQSQDAMKRQVRKQKEKENLYKNNLNDNDINTKNNNKFNYNNFGIKKNTSDYNKEFNKYNGFEVRRKSLNQSQKLIRPAFRSLERNGGLPFIQSQKIQINEKNQQNQGQGYFYSKKFQLQKNQ
ncbi:Cyclic nucleotide-binding protein [Pseudocohnilembus persalinus]|uniref:Cyclic nucleotide-binding protein n=1 Tax=Pseudocohnilembus persalinus TaxID=266149 RepID=A0A0V0QVA6_PSEPJ|nr:Cyclic nucleotide-binding protein [Pseudocohnilembus persalinus]|eukprot:KRX06097.1 Cyclic nucleotide-binding protein [Pseudocohnilembus persalinus]